MTLGAIPRGPGFNSRSAHSFSALVAIISYIQHCLQRLFRADPEHFVPAEHPASIPAPPITPEHVHVAPAPAPSVSPAPVTPPCVPAPQRTPAAPKPISRVHSERIESPDPLDLLPGHTGASDTSSVRSNGNFNVPVNFGDWSGSVDPINSIPGPTAHLACLLALVACLQLDPDIPFSMRNVPLHPQRNVWQGAAQKEIDMIHERKVWKLVPRPKDCRVLSLRMVFAHKRNSAGDITKHKARLVVRGYEQQEGTDFNETFAPVAKFQSICILLALATQNNWHIHQMDVDSAFLYADLEEELYMEQPEGFVEPSMEDYACLLLKALYGLKQASQLGTSACTLCCLSLASFAPGLINVCTSCIATARHGVFFVAECSCELYANSAMGSSFAQLFCVLLV
jgi:hypothetical protein